MARFILSLWPLDDDDQFISGNPAWESATIDEPENAEAAYLQLTHSVAWAILGDYHTCYNLSLDLLDEDGVGVSTQIRTLRFSDAPVTSALTPTERALFANYAGSHPIEAHQREAEQARIVAFPLLLAAYNALLHSNNAT